MINVSNRLNLKDNFLCFEFISMIIFLCDNIYEMETLGQSTISEKKYRIIFYRDQIEKVYFWSFFLDQFLITNNQF